MKLLQALLTLQLLDLTSAQSDCPNDPDTFHDGTGPGGKTGNGCGFYKGKDCIATATKLGLSDTYKRRLLDSCRFACGYCGKDTIVKECKDNSCQCKDTAGWQLTSGGTTLTCARQKSTIGCIYEAMNRRLSDKQIREYFTNCASSCRVCTSCGNVVGIGDGICDPGNNNAKCYRIINKEGDESPRYDGGDCCNKNLTPFFEPFGDNTLRYKACVKSGTLYDKQFCKCLAPATARKNDCVGAFSAYGDCSVTCEVGVRKREFIVLSPAKAGGHPCEFKHGYIQEDTCGLASRKCPTTTTATTTTTTTTTTIATTASAKSDGPGKSPGIDGGDAGEVDGGESDSEKSDSKTVNEAEATTIATMLLTGACMIYLFI